MKKNLCVLAMAGCVLWVASAGTAQANPQNPRVILQSEWLVEHDGQNPAAPWQVRGEQFGRVVLDASRRGLTAADHASVRIEDANREGLGPSFGGTFAEPVNGSLRILFDFQLEAGATNQPTMVLEDSSGKAGLFLALNNNSFPLSIRGSNIINRSGSQDGQLIHPLRTDTWYRVELLVWPSQVGRYTATVTQHGGEPMRVEGLPFREILSDYAGIRFLSNANKGAGTLNVANVMVERDIDIRLAGDPRSVERRTIRETSVLRVDPAAAAGGDGSAARPFATVENMMRGTDMTAAFTTWAAGSWRTLNANLENSPYQSPIWREAYPRLADILEDDPEKPKYCVVKNNLRYAAPMVIGQHGIHESFRSVGWVENNPQIDIRPGDYDAEQGRFVPNPESGLFERLPELRSIPFNFIGRY